MPLLVIGRSFCPRPYLAEKGFFPWPRRGSSLDWALGPTCGPTYILVWTPRSVTPHKSYYLHIKIIKWLKPLRIIKTTSALNEGNMLFSIDCESLPFFSFLFLFSFFFFFGKRGVGGVMIQTIKCRLKRKNESCRPNFHDKNLSSAI